MCFIRTLLARLQWVYLYLLFFVFLIIRSVEACCLWMVWSQELFYFVRYFNVYHMEISNVFIFIMYCVLASTESSDNMSLLIDNRLCKFFSLSMTTTEGLSAGFIMILLHSGRFLGANLSSDKSLSLDCITCSF